MRQKISSLWEESSILLHNSHDQKSFRIETLFMNEKIRMQFWYFYTSCTRFESKRQRITLNLRMLQNSDFLVFYYTKMQQYIIMMRKFYEQT